nr:CHAT domain-containing protein [Xenococcaceae cyanobacterium MO_188.B29]
DLRQSRLTVLSACETGLTDFRSLTDEYIGLPSGFLYAGSPNVVSSLWAVNDLSTAFLMIKLYQNLQDKDFHDSVPIALNQAQL